MEKQGSFLEMVHVGQGNSFFLGAAFFLQSFYKEQGVY
jgi:hypothetical protein